MQKRARYSLCHAWCTLLVVFFLTVLTAAPAAAADGGKLTLQLKNVSVKELLQTIEKQSDYTFVYNNSDFDINRKVSVNVTDASLEAVLAEAIPEVTATVRANRVILVRNSPPPLETA